MFSHGGGKDKVINQVSPKISALFADVHMSVYAVHPCTFRSSVYSCCKTMLIYGPMINILQLNSTKIGPDDVMGAGGPCTLNN